MTSVLRIYEPGECDEHGVPLDWERCRMCAGSGEVVAEMAVFPTSAERCLVCDGHGSLRAAALAHLASGKVKSDYLIPAEGAAARAIRGVLTVRCEGCGHPMSDGTWEAPQGPPPGSGEGGVWGPPRLPEHAAYLASVEGWLRASGSDPRWDPRWAWVHWSPCDEECRHGGPFQVYSQDTLIANITASYPGGAADHARQGGAVRASWRQVDVRTLSWPHDLRPEHLSVRCLRCWAER